MARRRQDQLESPVELKGRGFFSRIAGQTQRRGFHKNRRSNSKKRFSRDHRQLTGEIQKKRFCRTSCSCKTKREVRDFTGPTGIIGKIEMELPLAYTQPAENAEQDSKEEVLTPAAVARRNSKERGLCTRPAAVEFKRRGCYRTT